MTINQITVNHKLDKNTPQFDVQLLFDEIGVALDDNQYRDAISVVDMYHVYIRQRQVTTFSCQEMLTLGFTFCTLVQKIPSKRRGVQGESTKSIVALCRPGDSGRSSRSAS